MNPHGPWSTSCQQRSTPQTPLQPPSRQAPACALPRLTAQAYCPGLLPNTHAGQLRVAEQSVQLLLGLWEAVAVVGVHQEHDGVHLRGVREGGVRGKGGAGERGMRCVVERGGGGCHPELAVQACCMLLLGCCDTSGWCFREGLLRGCLVPQRRQLATDC